MLDRTPRKTIVQAQCPACMGSGSEPWSEERLTRGACRGCFGSGFLDVVVSDECEDAIWDEAITMLELVGVERDEEAYTYRWRDHQGWVVVSYEQAKQGGVQ